MKAPCAYTYSRLRGQENFIEPAAKFIILPVVGVFHAKMRAGHHIAVICLNHGTRGIGIYFHHVQFTGLILHIVKPGQPADQPHNIFLLQVGNELGRYFQIHQKLLATPLADLHRPLKSPKQYSADIAQLLSLFFAYQIYVPGRVFIVIAFVFDKRENFPIQ